MALVFLVIVDFKSANWLKAIEEINGVDRMALSNGPIEVILQWYQLDLG